MPGIFTLVPRLHGLCKRYYGVQPGESLIISNSLFLALPCSLLQRTILFLIVVFGLEHNAYVFMSKISLRVCTKVAAYFSLNLCMVYLSPGPGFPSPEPLCQKDRRFAPTRLWLKAVSAMKVECLTHFFCALIKLYDLFCSVWKGYLHV